MKNSQMNIFRMIKLKTMFCSYISRNKTGYIAAAFLLLLSFEKSAAQNINRPNKMGPMGMEINTNTGNMYLSRTDIYIPGRQLDFDISFNYNSYNYTENTGYGNGWSFKYNLRYKLDTAGRVVIIWSDGREDTYTTNGNQFISPAGFFDSLSQYQPSKYILKTKAGLRLYFDNNTHKRLTKVQEPNGNTLNFTYADSLISSITNSAGQVITLSYASAKLISITDANASPVQTYTYTYDDYGNLTKVTDPAGGTNKYTYLVNGPMSSITDKNNNNADLIYYSDFSAKEIITCNSRMAFSYDTTVHTTTVIDFVPTATNQVSTYVYNDKGWLSKLTGNCCGYSMAFSYDNNGNLIERKDANGNSYRYTYDNRGNYLTITDPQGSVTTYTYSSNFSQITGVTDALGNSYTRDYDAVGNVTGITRPGNLQRTFTYHTNGDLISAKDENNSVTEMLYDAYGYPQKIIYPLKKEIFSTFDARSNLLSGRDANGNTYSYQYDSMNRVTKVLRPLNLTQNFTYDKEGNITSYTDAKGFRNQLFYDASNRIVSVKDPKGAISSYSYDAMDNLIQYSDQLGNTTSLTYDNLNRLTSITDPVGNGHGFSYDAAGNMVNAVNPFGNSVNYIYDELNRVVGGSDSIGSIGSIAYDKNGRMTSFTNASGASVLFTYDNLNRLTTITDPLGNSRAFTYDNNNNRLSQKDRNNHISSSTYNALNRITSFTDNNNNHINVQYDSIGQVTKLTDQNGNSTLYQYDALNRRIKTIYPDGRYVAVTYDNNSNITSAKLADGSTINYSYDSTNKLISKILPGGERYLYTYDVKRRLVAAGNAAGVISLTYDNLDRLTSETYGSHTTSYSYNVPSRTISTTYPGGGVVTKAFDKRARLTNILLNNQLLTGYQYNNINQLTQKTYSNGVITNYQYDKINRLSSVSSNKTNLPSLSFSYDNEMNKTVVARANDPQYSETFGYDANYRLINYKQGVLNGNVISNALIQNTYSYDAIGNRTAASLNGLNTNYSINNLNQYTHLDNTNQNINYTYDGNGNQTNDGNFYMRYDAEGRKLVDSIAGNIYRYVYDAMGRRIVKSINGMATNYSYAGLQQIEERNDTDAVVARQVFENFMRPVQRDYNGQKYLYHQNDLSSTEAITDSAGNLIERYRYEDFGKTYLYDAQNNRRSTSAINNRFLFTGQEYDFHDSSYKFHFRNYSTALGSFNQRDPIGYGDGMSMYQYVRNNPGNHVDMFGLILGDPYTNFWSLFGGGSIQEQEGDVTGEFSDPTNINVAEFYRGDPCKHDKFKHRYITKSILEQQKHYMSTTYSREANPNSLMAGWQADSHFYNEWQSNLGDNKFIFNGEAMNNWEVNYYFTQYANASRGGIVGNEAMQFTTTFVWNEGKAIASGTPFTRTQELVPKEMLTLDAHDDFVNNRHNNHNLDEQLYDFDPKNDYEKNEFGEWWPVENPYTHKWGREFFAKKYIKKSRWKDFTEYIKKNCPPNNENHGTQKPKPGDDGKHVNTEVVTNHDPNEMIGPDGVGNNKWVSVNDRLPYSILFENDKSATAPVKVVKVIYPIDPKQDASTFQLGGFGFNNLTFNVPANTNAYYQRLNVKDSLGLYIDITAGVDPIKNQAFWIFESIDTTTQLPTSDPLKGFLLKPDSLNPAAGQGFVNFTIKPLNTAHTRDTISAYASILFDANDTIPTNRAKNTIDALPPVTHLNSAAQAGNSRTFKLTWNGGDDTGGSGISSYVLYVSVSNKPFTLYRSQITDTSLLFTGSPDSTYCFFVAAKDSVNNEEALSNNCDLSYRVSTSTLPVTWLDFSGTRRADDALLMWSIANERNTKSFVVERSRDGSSFNSVGNISAAGNSSGVGNYQFTDPGITNLGVTIIYYRIKEVDNDGHFVYSSTIALRIDNASKDPLITAFPNPFNRYITLKVIPASAEDKTNNIELYSLQGTLLYKKDIGKQGSTITTLNDLPALPSGMYILKTFVNGVPYSTRLIKN